MLEHLIFYFSSENIISVNLGFANIFEHIIPPLFLSLFHPMIFGYSLVIIFLSISSGIVIGFSLGLIGGGGSILAVPLLTFAIGLEPHIAIGTSALAVAVNAAINMIYHHKKNNNHVNIKKGIMFAIPGVFGTVIGSQLGLITPAKNLLFLFASFMIIIAIKMLIEARINNRNKREIKAVVGKPRSNDTVIFNKSAMIWKSFVNKNKKIIVLSKNKLFMVVGFIVGLSAGYFGIGGGFLIVPVFLHFGMNISDAIGTSLIPISIFGLTTALRYSVSYQVDWIISFLLIIGGMVGGILGIRISENIPKNILSKTFAITLIALGIYIVIISL